MQSIIKFRKISVRCNAESSRPIQNKLFPLLDGPGAKKRNISVKENINKLVAIGNAEIKEVYNLAIELDEAHKKAFNYKDKESKQVIVYDEAESTDDEDNIFSK
jgi:hypothetical protein